MKPKHPCSGGSPLGPNRFSTSEEPVRLAKSRLPNGKQLAAVTVLVAEDQVKAVETYARNLRGRAMYREAKAK